MKLAAPWIKFKNELTALFGDDDGIAIEYNDAERKVWLYVADPEKADALSVLLPAVKNFGNENLYIYVVPTNVRSKTNSELFDAAFKGNPAVSFVRDVDTPFGEMKYVVFKKEVVQYYNDDMSDLNGNCSTLYQEIAKDVFPDRQNVCFCTDTAPANTAWVKSKE